MILVMWLFALGAGVANACLLNTPNDSSPSSFSGAYLGTPVAPERVNDFAPRMIKNLLRKVVLISG